MTQPGNYISPGTADGTTWTLMPNPVNYSPLRIPAIQYHQWIPAQPQLKVKLEKGQKNTYAWEITYESAEDILVILAKLKEADDKLRATFKVVEEERKV